MRRLSTADALVADRLFVKGNAAGLDTGLVLDLILTGFVAAPHRANKAGFLVGDLNELVPVMRVPSTILPVFKRLCVQTVMHRLKRCRNSRLQFIERNNDLFAGIF